MTRVVAFTGPAGSGKTTAAGVLADHLGFRVIKFAGPLKAMLRAFYEHAGMEPAEIERRIEGDLKETPCPLLGGATPRRAMQTLGTEWGRDIIAPDLWIRAWRAAVETCLACGGRVVTDDLRFENEADAVREIGGVVAGLRGRRAAVEGHASEAGVMPDFSIENAESREALAADLIYVFGPGE